ncbi:MAG: hypothetical protein HYR51_18125 [Candidatus Rokubacteria bacterium]|nr:hypothetical protein [Candidatus Rokubacteria bacterium]
MAVVCRERRLLYLLNPRTGGSAIAKQLIDHFGGEGLPKDHILAADGSILLQQKHQTLAQLLRFGVVTAEEAGQYIAFTNVCNPFDSLVSLYVKYRDRYARIRDEGEFWITHSGPTVLGEIDYCRSHPFNEWVARTYWKPVVLTLVRRRRFSINEGYPDGCRAVLRKEFLQDDFTRFLRDFGIPGDPVLPVHNRTEAKASGASYRDYYSPLSRALVAITYRDDLARWGYRF